MTNPDKEIDEILATALKGVDYRNYEFKKTQTKSKLNRLLLSARKNELENSFREFSKDVPFDERLAYYDNRIKELEQ